MPLDLDDFVLDTTGLTADNLHADRDDPDVEVVTFPAVTPIGIFTSRTGVDISRMLTLDFETGPDMTRAHLFVDPQVQEKTPLDACPEVAKFFAANKNVGDVVTAIDALNPCEEWLETALEFEKSNQKPRKGVVDPLVKLLTPGEDPIAKLAAVPHAASITAVGWCIGNGPPQGVLVKHPEVDVHDGMEERDCIQMIWDLIENEHVPIVGYSILGFDIPLLFFRSMLLGVTPPRKLDVSPYSQRDCLDLYVAMNKPGKLKPLLAQLGIEHPTPGIDGSMAWELYQTDRPKLLNYVKGDAWTERELFKLCSGFFVY